MNTICAVLLYSALLPGAKPNVLIFYTDDQGTLDVGCYGATDLRTPNMDRLAKEGVRFTAAYAHTVCCPSRAALMTGRHPQRSNVNSWTQGRTFGVKGRNLALEEVTLAESLSDAGYATGLFGKWHIGAHPEHGPMKQGFDEFVGIRSGFIDNFNHYALHGIGSHDLFNGTKEIFHRGQYFPDLMCDKALSFIERNKDRPFFLYFPMNLPHYPEQVVGHLEDAYTELSEPRRSYCKAVSACDQYLGRLLAQLDRFRLLDNTIILFTSDNGHSEEDYQIRVDNHLSGLPKGANYGANGGGGFTGKWIGAKGSFLEGGVRVPAILRYPEKLPKGEVRHQEVTIMDWLPTILELCDVEHEADVLDGRSVMPLVEDEGAESLHKTLHWQWQKGWAVRHGEWKLIVNGTRGLGQPKLDPITLVNLEDEEPEAKNYAEIRPDMIQQLWAKHLDWAKDVFQSFPED